MRPSRASLPADGGKQFCVRSRDSSVVVDYGDDASHVVLEPLATGAVDVIGEQYAYQKLSDGHSGDCHFVVILDQFIECCAVPVGVYQEGRIEQETAQGRASVSSTSRTDAMSSAKPVSPAWCRSRAFRSAPLPVLSGASCATALPLRTIV